MRILFCTKTGSERFIFVFHLLKAFANDFNQSKHRKVFERINENRIQLHCFRELLLLLSLKAGFHMIADDRGSQIVDRRRSQRELFPYNRRRSQTIAEPTVAIHFVLLQANLFPLLVLKRRQRQLQNRRKHRFWIRKYSIKFLADFFRLLDFLCLSM